jgi:hypothetical protein
LQPPLSTIRQLLHIFHASNEQKIDLKSSLVGWLSQFHATRPGSIPTITELSPCVKDDCFSSLRHPRNQYGRHPIQSAKKNSVHFVHLLLAFSYYPRVVLLMESQKVGERLICDELS